MKNGFKKNGASGSRSNDAPQPLYMKVRQYIEERINSKNWPIDTKIPSENELVKTLGVSRMTINRALRELTAEGYLMRLQGVGTFVARRKPQSALLEIRSIAEEIKSRGGIHTSDVHLLEKKTATPELAAGMDMNVGDPVFHVIIVHKDKQIPIQLADRYVNPVVAPEFFNQDFTKITPNQYLMQIAPATEVEHIIEAVLPDENVQKLLEIKPGEPCILLNRKTWAKGIVVTKSRFIYPGSRYRIGGRFVPSSEKGIINTL